MKIIDLTHTLHSEMPVFPGTEQPKLYTPNTIEKDGFQETLLSMYSHTGTHIDAPAHMLANAHYLDDLDINHFIGKAVILDFSNIDMQYIDLDMLKQYEEKIKQVEFVIIKTGWSKYWGDKRYFNNFPAISDEAGKWLSSFKLKGVGVDTISIDAMTTKTFAVHKHLLSKDIVIIENLTNLDEVDSEDFVLSVLPLKYAGADGSPVRAVGMVEEVFSITTFIP